MKNSPKKILKYTVLGLSLAVLLGLFVCVVLPSVYGYPKWVNRMVGESIAPPNGNCEIESIVGSIFSGFEIRDVEMTYPSPCGTFQTNIPHASIALRPLSFLKGQIKPKTFSFSDGNVILNLPDTETSPKESLAIINLNGNAQCTSYGAVNAQITGFFKDINIIIDANLLDFYDVVLNVHKDNIPLPEINPTAVATLHNISREVSAITNNASDVYLSVNASGSLKTPEQIRITGTTGLAEAFVKGRFLPKASAKFSYENASLNFSDLHIFYNAAESLWCKAAINFLSSSYHCSFQADLMPETIIQILGMQQDYSPNFITFNSPIHIDGEIPDASWKDTTFTPNLSFACNDIFLANMTVPHISGNLKYNENTIDVPQILLAFDEEKNYFLEGSCKLTLKDNLLAANLAGRVDLGELCHGLDIIQTRETPLAAFTDARVQATLEPSNMHDWRNWSCKLNVSQQAGEFAKLPIRDINMEVSLNNNLLKLDSSAIINADTENLFNIHAQTSLPENLQTTPLVVSVAPHFQIQNTTALDASAKLTVNWQEHSISADCGNGTLRPELIWNILEKPLKFGRHNPLSFLKCNNPDKPIAFNFHIPSVYWRNQKESWDVNSAKWQINGSTEMSDICIINADFDSATADFTLDSEKISLRNVHGTMKDNAANGDLELDFWFLPFKMTIRNLEFVGDPSKVAPLTYANAAIHIYNMVWQDFKWQEGCAPHINVNNLEFRNLDNDFFLTLDGTAHIHNFIYNSMSIHDLATDIKLTLPEGGLDIINASITAPNESNTILNGNAHMDFKEGVNGNFFIEKKQGSFALVEFLESIAPPAREHLEQFSISHDTEFQCKGRFSYANFLTLDLNGTLNTPFLQFRDIQLQNMKGTWKASNRNFFWDFPEAEFYGGTLASTGNYDIETKTCDFLARAKEIPLDELLSIANAKLSTNSAPPKATKNSADGNAAASKTPGKLDAEGHFKLLKDWAGRPLHLEGDGKIHIYDADLWRVPTLTTLGKILAGGTLNLFSRKSIASLGKISDLKTNFECHGTHVNFQNIRTDGSFIALKGEGQYYLEDNALDFQISGQLLKSVSIISLLLKPITWAFDAQLTGTPQDYEWHLRSPIRKLFE